MSKWIYVVSQPDGETWAVCYREDGTVAEACGPLHYSEVTQVNLDEGDFNNDPETAQWVEENPNLFHQLTTEQIAEIELSKRG